MQYSFLKAFESQFDDYEMNPNSIEYKMVILTSSLKDAESKTIAELQKTSTRKSINEDLKEMIRVKNDHYTKIKSDTSIIDRTKERTKYKKIEKRHQEKGIVTRRRRS